MKARLTEGLSKLSLPYVRVAKILYELNLYEQYGVGNVIIKDCHAQKFK